MTWYLVKHMLVTLIQLCISSPQTTGNLQLGLYWSLYIHHCLDRIFHRLYMHTCNFHQNRSFFQVYGLDGRKSCIRSGNNGDNSHERGESKEPWKEGAAGQSHMRDRPFQRRPPPPWELLHLSHSSAKQPSFLPASLKSLSPEYHSWTSCQTIERMHMHIGFHRGYYPLIMCNDYEVSSK